MHFISFYLISLVAVGRVLHWGTESHPVFVGWSGGLRKLVNVHLVLFWLVFLLVLNTHCFSWRHCRCTNCFTEDDFSVISKESISSKTLSRQRIAWCQQVKTDFVNVHLWGGGRFWRKGSLHFIQAFQVFFFFLLLF